MADEQKDPTKTTHTVSLPIKLSSEAREYAEAHYMSFSQLTTQALKLYLDVHKTVAKGEG